MWTVQSARPVPEGTVKVLEELNQGEIWSINSKAKKFVLSSINVEANTMDVYQVNGEKLGDTVTMPYADYRGRTVTVWGSVPEVNVPTPLSLFDRVTMKGSELKGIVVDASEQISVLWDDLNDGRWITDAAANDLVYCAESLTEAQLKKAKTARSLVQDMHYESGELKQEQALKDRLAAQALARQKFSDAEKQQHRAAAEKLAGQILSTYAQEFKHVIQSGMLLVTAGEEDGNIAKIAEIVESHIEDIRTKASVLTNEEHLKTPAIVAATKMLINAMYKEYFLTRHSYIQEKNGKYGVYSKAGKMLGNHESSKKAVAQMRGIEWRQRNGYHDTELN